MSHKVEIELGAGGSHENSRVTIDGKDILCRSVAFRAGVGELTVVVLEVPAQVTVRGEAAVVSQVPT